MTDTVVHMPSLSLEAFLSYVSVLVLLSLPPGHLLHVEKIQANLDENYFIDTTEPVKNRNILGEEIEHKNQEYGYKNSKKQETKRNLTLQELIETKKSILLLI